MAALDLPLMTLDGRPLLIVKGGDPAAQAALSKVIRDFDDPAQLRRLGFALVQIADYWAGKNAAERGDLPPIERVTTMVATAFRAGGLEDDPVRLAVRKEASDLATMPGRGWTADIGFASGIYALSDGLEILYVGQSRGITQRLREHARTRPIAWAFASPCAVERLDEVERTIIRSISPPWNSSHAQRRRARP